MKPFICNVVFVITLSNPLYGQTWSFLTTFPGSQASNRSGIVSFSIGNKIYEGCGSTSTAGFKDLWEYNTDNNAWTQKANYPGVGETNHLSFSIGNLGYVGLGTNVGFNAFPKDFWEYNSNTNTWRRLADFPDVYGRINSAFFVINGKAYVFGGLSVPSPGDNHEVKNDLWEYNPATNIWTKKATLAGDENRRLDAFGFSINGNGYIGGGWGDLTGPLKNDLWYYSPASNLWYWGGYLPGTGLNTSGLSGCSTASNCERAFVFLGHTSDGFYIPKNYWVYSYNYPTFSRLPDFPTTTGSNSNIAAINGYFINGQIIGGFPNHYKYSYNEISGPSLVCTSGTFSLTNVSPPSVISWQSSNPSGFIINSSGVGTRQGSFNGEVTITGSINRNGCVQSITKKIQVGSFNSGQIIVSGQAGVCNGNSYTYTASVPGGHKSGYTYSWTYPSGWSVFSQNQNSITLYVPSYNSQYGTVLASVNNGCGTSGYSGITVYPGFGCGGSYYMSVYPNPAKEELVVEMKSSEDNLKSDQPMIDEVVLFNGSGEIVKTSLKPNKQIRLNLQGLKNGRYLLNVRIGKDILKEQVIID